MLVNRNKKLA